MSKASNIKQNTAQEIVIEEMQPVARGSLVERRANRPVGLAQGDGLDRNVWSLLGTPLDTLTMAETVGYVDRAVRTDEKLWLSTPNLDWMHMSKSDPEFHRSVVASDLSVCDGMPVMLLAKIAGIPLRTRVPGSGLFTRLREVKPSFRGARSVFFFGGRDGAAEKATEALATENGGVIGIGSYNPGFGTIEEMSDEATLERINAEQPDLLIVSLSSRKGQLWIGANRDRLNAKVIAPLGAVVDFTAGTIKRAPSWMQKVGLEWLWRIKEDPQIAKRYAKNFTVLPGFAMRCLAIRYLLARRAKAPAVGAKLTPSTMKMVNTEAVVTLGSDARSGNLKTVRDSLRQAIAADANIRISFVGNSAFDLSLIGLLQLAEHKCRENGHSLKLVDVDKTAQRIFSLNGHHLAIITGQDAATAPQREAMPNHRTAS